MKITEYTKITTLPSANVFLTDGTEGTKTITASALVKALSGILASDDLYAMLDRLLAGEQHRAIFRGKNLGSSFTTTQKSAVSAGTFKDLYLGDYWVIGGVTWRIVDFDYWYNKGDTAFTKHHLVIMPDARLYAAKMNDTNTTEGGYVNSAMYTTNLEQAKTTIQSAFGSAVLTHRERLVNAVTNGQPSGASYYNSTVELPTEIMMYGSRIYAAMANNGVTVPQAGTLETSQLALMQAVPRFINPNRQDVWLRDVVSASGFAFVYYAGGAGWYGASGSYGVRPVFAIGS